MIKESLNQSAPTRSAASTQLRESKTVEIAAPADSVWAIVRDFADMTWVPAVKASTATNGNIPGSNRTLDFGGTTLTEELVTYDATGRTYTYAILDTVANRAVVPVANLVATISVKPVSDTASCATWKGTFYRLDPGPHPAADADDATAQKKIQGTFEMGLSALKKEAEAKSAQ